ncbi:MAG: M23 family metallopeptidase [Rikenellaceae bacterium]
MLRKLIIGFILASIVNLFVSSFFYTPKMYFIMEENSEMTTKYNILNDKINSASLSLAEIRHRDLNVYRTLFAADTTTVQGAYSPYNYSKYESFEDDKYHATILNSWLALDDLARRMYVSSISLDELQELSKDKGDMAEAIPAIWPLDRTLMRGNIGAFGYRIHPIYKRYIMHEGIDMGGPRGTPIYATGNGIISSAKTVSGYGKQILIDHGFGYQTRYAHLDDIGVEVGQEVKRGEQIGKLGNTGRSTGPHLHYEVIYMGRHVDPINYFSRDMPEDEYAKIIESATSTTYEQD